VVTDSDIRGIGGVEATRRLVDLLPGVRVIAYSALDDSSAMREAAAVDFVTKGSPTTNGSGKASKTVLIPPPAGAAITLPACDYVSLPGDVGAGAQAKFFADVLAVVLHRLRPQIAVALAIG
jgi:CheY-like chemotaxis protein